MLLGLEGMNLTWLLPMYPGLEILRVGFRDVGNWFNYTETCKNL